MVNDAKSGCGQATGTAATLFVTPDPSVSIVSGDSIICKGGSANFVVNGSGGTNLTYQWQYHNGTNFVNVTNTTIGAFTYVGATTNTLQINTTQSVASNTTGYRYQVLVSDSKSGCVTATSAEVKLIVKEDPSVTTQAQDSIWYRRSG